MQVIGATLTTISFETRASPSALQTFYGAAVASLDLVVVESGVSPEGVVWWTIARPDREVIAYLWISPLPEGGTRAMVVMSPGWHSSVPDPG